MHIYCSWQFGEWQLEEHVESQLDVTRTVLSRPLVVLVIEFLVAFQDTCHYVVLGLCWRSCVCVCACVCMCDDVVCRRCSGLVLFL